MKLNDLFEDGYEYSLIIRQPECGRELNGGPFDAAGRPYRRWVLTSKVFEEAANKYKQFWVVIKFTPIDREPNEFEDWEDEFEIKSREFWLTIIPILNHEFLVDTNKDVITMSSLDEIITAGKSLV